LGEPLVESFNASFEKGEMSPSQKLAVITLTEKKIKIVVILKTGGQFLS